MQAVEAKVLDNLSEQTTAEKSATKTAADIKQMRKQGETCTRSHCYTSEVPTRPPSQRGLHVSHNSCSFAKRSASKIYYLELQ